MVNIENSNGQAADAYHRGHYALTNLLFTPAENVMVGGEFQWGRREDFLDGFASNDYRVQFSFKSSPPLQESSLRPARTPTSAP